MQESYHTRRVFTPEEFSFAIDMLDTYPWIRRQQHRRGFDEMMDSLVIDAPGRRLLQELLEKFIYVGLDECEDLLNQIINKLEQWGCKLSNTVFLAIRTDPRENDGSNVFQKQLQDRLFGGWRKKNFVNFFDYRHRFHTVVSFDKVILIDDFIGSGDTMADRLQTFLKVIGEVNPDAEVYVVALAGMKVAKIKHPELNDDHVFVPLWLSSAFVRGADVSRTAIMDEILTRLHKTNDNSQRHSIKKYGYGYGDTAALYYNVHYRIPNNVLSIFWWGRFKHGKEEYHSMFRRS